MGSIYQTKPLGTYACGGKCDAEGFNGTDVSYRTPCPKCRVYVVTPGEYIHTDGILVRARKGTEALATYERHHPGHIKISVRLHNHRNNAGSTTVRFKRDKVGDPWKRALQRPEPEKAAKLLAYHTYRKANIVVRDWKLSPEMAAAALELGLKNFLREHGLEKASR